MCEWKTISTAYCELKSWLLKCSKLDNNYNNNRPSCLQMFSEFHHRKRRHHQQPQRRVKSQVRNRKEQHSSLCSLDKFNYVKLNWFVQYVFIYFFFYKFNLNFLVQNSLIYRKERLCFGCQFWQII